MREANVLAVLHLQLLLQLYLLGYGVFSLTSLSWLYESLHGAFKSSLEWEQDQPSAVDLCHRRLITCDKLIPWLSVTHALVDALVTSSMPTCTVAG